jgi:BirA family transcriptional regulator, biotin operon repressor / biotin---[acetyl-CoA-carboxylase] ligase
VSPAAAHPAAARLVGGPLHALGEIASTQDELARLAAAGAPEGTVVTALHQTGGRGRRGRVWLDAPGDSLLCSILLRPALPAASTAALSLVAAVAVSEAVAAVAGVAAGIRWPNDLLVGDRKLCGILAEAAADGAGRVESVRLGIGLNVDQAEFPPPIRALATSLRLVTGRAHDRAGLLGEVLIALDRRYGEFLAAGFAPARAEWRRRSVTLGRWVRVGGLCDPVLVEDVDEAGALLARDAAGRAVRLTSGEPVDAAGPAWAGAALSAAAAAGPDAPHAGLAPGR